LTGAFVSGRHAGQVNRAAVPPGADGDEPSRSRRRLEFADARSIRLLPAGNRSERVALRIHLQAKIRSSRLGFAAIRTTVPRRRQGDQGTANPLAGDTQFAIHSACRSHCGRCDFLWLGFTPPRTDGGVRRHQLDAHRIFMNYGSLTGANPRQHIARRFPEFQPPFTTR
jgi:hypothetical protein